MGRLNRSSCRSFIKVSSDRQRSGLSFLMKIVILPIFKISMVGSTAEGSGLTFLMKIGGFCDFQLSPFICRKGFGESRIFFGSFLFEKK